MVEKGPNQKKSDLAQYGNIIVQNSNLYWKI